MCAGGGGSPGPSVGVTAPGPCALSSGEEQAADPASPLSAKRRVLSQSALRSHRPVARPVSMGLSRCVPAGTVVGGGTQPCGGRHASLPRGPPGLFVEDVLWSGARGAGGRPRVLQAAPDARLCHGAAVGCSRPWQGLFLLFHS